MASDEAGDADAWRAPKTDADDLVFLQYTSGSTQTPKGVMVSHGNLLHNSEVMRRLFRHGPDSCGVIWLPPFHDMGLIGGLLQPLYAGFPVVLMTPGAFIQRPRRWLEAVSRYRATTSGGPNFAFELCVERVTAGTKPAAGLDLGSWRVAVTGSEPIRAETLERFSRAFAPAGFRREAFFPSYGLAEATLLVSRRLLRRGDAGSVGRFSARRFGAGTPPGCPRRRPTTPGGKDLVSCGAVAPDEEVVIADPETRRRCGAGEVGEIWVRGPSVAHGYWNRPEETAAAFHARLDDGGGPFLRTGDLGFLRGGELFVAGRIRDLIIIRGANVYPQDVERTVGACHPSLRPDGAAAFAVEADGEERLVVVQEVEALAPDDAAEVLAAVRHAVADAHQLQAYAVVLVRAGRIPRTTSGKIQRTACRTEFQEDGLAGVLASWRAGREESLRPSREARRARRRAAVNGQNGDGGGNGHATTSTLTAEPPKANGEHLREAWPLPETVRPGDDLDLDFFRLFLDTEYLSEGAGDWDAAQTLEAAQGAKLRRLAGDARGWRPAWRPRRRLRLGRRPPLLPRGRGRRSRRRPDAQPAGV